MTAAPVLKRNVWWIRDPANPVLPPGDPGSFDAGCAMNPHALRIGDEYHLYYAGGGPQGRRICLATAAVSDPHHWQRHGPLFESGAPGSFDASWCVLPHVARLAPDHWHLYYTGRSDHGAGLSAFAGIGLAVSRDGRHWERHSDQPVLTPSGNPGDPDAMGVAGGCLLRARLPNGTSEWRLYYTGCPTLGDDVFLNQQKTACLAVSQDAIHWERRGAVLRRVPDHDYENVAVGGRVVQQETDGSYRMWYSAIGTRWGYYSICYAESDDGITWRRGTHYGDNLQLGPTGTGWESQMVEYPSVLPDASPTAEGAALRLFYCGNGYGATGIGTAVAAPLRATPEGSRPTVRIVSAVAPVECVLRIPAHIGYRHGSLPVDDNTVVRWHGPDAHGTIWHEWQDAAGVMGLQYRVLVSPTAQGLAVRCTLINGSDRCYRDMSVSVRTETQTRAPESSTGVAITWNTADGTVVPPGAGEPPGRATLCVDELAPGATRTLRGTVVLRV